MAEIAEKKSAVRELSASLLIPVECNLLSFLSLSLSRRSSTLKHVLKLLGFRFFYEESVSWWRLVRQGC